MNPAVTVVLITLAVTAASAQDPGLASAVAAAEKQLEAGASERALVLLWDVERQLPGVESAVARKALRESVDALIAKADPLIDERRAAYAVAAKTMVKLSLRYRRKKWWQMSRAVLLTGRSFDPRVVEVPLRGVERTLARVQAATPPAPEKKVSASQAPVDLLQEFGPVPQGWHRTDVVRSPPPDNVGSLWLSQGIKHDDGWLRIDARLADGKGGAFLVFGVRGPETYHAFELAFDEKSGQGVISFYRFAGRAAMECLGSEWFDYPEARRKDWITLDIRIDGKRLEGRAGDIGPVIALTDAPPTGGLGLGILAQWSNTGPLEFRRLRIDPLPPHKGAGGKPAEESDPAAELLADIAELEKRLAAGDHEAVTLGLRALQERVAAVESAALRDSLATSVQTMLVAADPLLEHFEKAHRAVAETLVALAEKYTAEGRPIAALWQLQRAARFDASVARAPLTKLEKAFPVSIAEVRGLPVEPDQPLDNTALVEWFEGGSTLWNSGWTVNALTCTSPVLKDDAVSVLVANRPGATAGRARVQVRATEPGLTAGLVFAYRSQWNFCVLGVTLGEREARIDVWRYRNRWESIAKDTVKLTPEAAASWMTLDVAYGETGISARVGSGRRVIVNRRDLDLKGRFGLFANAPPGRIGAIQFRNFAVPQAKAAAGKGR